MKNAIGLLIAIGLGLVAAVLNWKYLDRKSQELEMVSFLGVNPESKIRPGDTFQDNHFVQLDIPRRQVGQLENTALKFSEKSTVVGLKSVRAYEGGELMLRQDLKTPPTELKLQPNERAMFIPVDTSSFVPSLVKPGDFVSFIVPKPGLTPPAPPTAEEGETPTPAVPAGANEIIGPFRILSLGNRLGSAEVFRAAGVSSAQENIMGISVTVTNDELDARSQKLFDRLKQSNFRQMGVLLHPPGKTK